MESRSERPGPSDDVPATNVPRQERTRLRWKSRWDEWLARDRRRWPAQSPVYSRSRALTAVTRPPAAAPSGSASTARTTLPGSHKPNHAVGNGHECRYRHHDHHSPHACRPEPGARRWPPADTRQPHPAEHAKRDACIQSGAARAHRKLRAVEMKRPLGPLMTNEGSRDVHRGSELGTATLPARACARRDGQRSEPRGRDEEERGERQRARHRTTPQRVRRGERRLVCRERSTSATASRSRP